MPLGKGTPLPSNMEIVTLDYVERVSKFDTDTGKHLFITDYARLGSQHVYLYDPMVDGYTPLNGEGEPAYSVIPATEAREKLKQGFTEKAKRRRKHADDPDEDEDEHNPDGHTPTKSDAQAFTPTDAVRPTLMQSDAEKFAAERGENPKAKAARAFKAEDKPVATATEKAEAEAKERKKNAAEKPVIQPGQPGYQTRDGSHDTPPTDNSPQAQGFPYERPAADKNANPSPKLPDTPTPGKGAN